MLNVCIVGLGWWGRIITESLSSSVKVRVVAATDLNSGQDFCDAHGIRYLASFSEALTDQHVDAVILTTPNALHEDQIKQAAAAGKHVFCEKPLCLTLAGAQKAVHACVDNGVRLAIGHERRFEPPVKYLQALIERGTLGRVLQIEGNFSQNKFLSLDPKNWRLSVEHAGCGPMTATGIHLLDLACSIAGAAQTVNARSYNGSTGFESGDNAAAQITFGNGVIASVNAMLSTPFYSRFAVFGTEGWIEIRDKSHVENPSGWTVIQSDSLGQVTTKDYPPAHPVRDNIEAFADAVIGTQDDYPISLQSMLDTVSLLEAVQDAAKSNKTVTPRRATLNVGLLT